MTKVEILFSMAIDGENGTVFQTNGSFSNGLINFIDPEGFSYTVEFEPNSVRIKRIGKTTMDLTFKPKITTEGLLTVDGMTFKFTVMTHVLQISTDKILINYDMIESGSVLSHHQMLIKWIHNGRNVKND